MKLRIAIVLALTLLMTSVFAQEKINYQTETSIPYYNKEKMEGDEYMQKMCVIDLYYPKNIKNFPTIVWFHGGGLTGGSVKYQSILKTKEWQLLGWSIVCLQM